MASALTEKIPISGYGTSFTQNQQSKYRPLGRLPDNLDVEISS